MPFAVSIHQPSSKEKLLPVIDLYHTVKFLNGHCPDIYFEPRPKSKLPQVVTLHNLDPIVLTTRELGEEFWKPADANDREWVAIVEHWGREEGTGASKAYFDFRINFSSNPNWRCMRQFYDALDELQESREVRVFVEPARHTIGVPKGVAVEFYRGIYVPKAWILEGKAEKTVGEEWEYEKN